MPKVFNESELADVSLAGVKKLRFSKEADSLTCVPVHLDGAGKVESFSAGIQEEMSRPDKDDVVIVVSDPKSESVRNRALEALGISV